MLVVWEPILATDWRSPGLAALARIPDQRAKQFWDPDHLIAQALSQIAKKKHGLPKPNCCVNKGFFWDEVILYSNNSKWQQAPPAVFWDGPVLYEVSGIEMALHKLG